MISGEKAVCIFNIDEDSIDESNGDRVLKVSDCKELVCFVDLVGVQTQQLGQSQGHKFSYSVEVPRLYYDSEKYCYFDNELYEIQGLGKAKSPSNMLLNVVKSKEQDVLSAIEKWMED